MNDLVKQFLSDMRHHPGFQEFLREADNIEPPFPRFKKGMAFEQFGADTLFASGRQDQHTRWLTFLTGTTSQTEEIKS